MWLCWTKELCRLTAISALWCAPALSGCYERVVNDSWGSFHDKVQGSDWRRSQEPGDDRGQSAQAGDQLPTSDETDVLDVRQYKDRWPYTLQVAVFEESTDQATRTAAEKHAAELRQQDHPAFYYHGPKRSMVTVGLFSDDDRVEMATTLPNGQHVVQFVYGPRIKVLQETFPHNLVNGRLHMETQEDGTDSPQSSALVIIK